MTIESLAALVEREFENVPKDFLEHLKGAERGAHHLTSLSIGKDKEYPNTVPDLGQVWVGLQNAAFCCFISDEEAKQLMLPLLETALELWTQGWDTGSFYPKLIAEAGGDRTTLAQGLYFCQLAWDEAMECIEASTGNEFLRGHVIVTRPGTETPRYWQALRFWAGKNNVRVIAVFVSTKGTKVLSNGNQITVLESIGGIMSSPYEADLPTTVPEDAIVATIRKALVSPKTTHNPFAELLKK